MAHACRARVLANLERSRLRQLYAQARIFWHAAGYGECDERPELSEHFGMATVEAMSAGCIPVVINKGGQPEIVEHGRIIGVTDQNFATRSRTLKDRLSNL